MTVQVIRVTEQVVTVDVQTARTSSVNVSGAGAVIQVRVPDATPVAAVIEQTAVVQAGLSGPPGERGVPGEPGIAGPAGGTYTHYQSSAASTWTIPHPLNRRPHVQIIDSAGTAVYGTIRYPVGAELTTVEASFRFPFSGIAELA